MTMRTVARGAWMGLGLALCLGTMETRAADASAAAATPATPKAAPAPASKPPILPPSQEERAQRERVEQVEKVAKDFSAKRDSAYVNEARAWDQRRRDEEAKALSKNGAPADSGKQGKD